ncbi:MAG: primosomal protein N' (replication factor Y) [Halieaceae bacterium]|jgi:primosomal protein N' (replication factor Y)
MVASDNTPVLRLAVPSPLRRCFDYLPPTNYSLTELELLQPGVRVRAPFAGRNIIAILVEIATSSELSRDKLKPVLEILDSKPLIDRESMALLQWAARYYHHPLGEVLHSSLPALLRRGKEAPGTGFTAWRLSHNGRGLPADALQRSPKQAAMVKLLQEHGECSAAALVEAGISSSISRALLNKELVEKVQRTGLAAQAAPTEAGSISLNSRQKTVVESVASTLGTYASHLLDGVTGSGKTEVYLQLIATCIDRGTQALVLIPEIGLTPQTIARFRERFGSSVVGFNSNMTDRQRLSSWQAAAGGEAKVIIGTRSSVFLPLPRPGIIIVDEEHDLSYKQQDNFRYHARDLAIKRAQLQKIPIVLGSATPSLESLHNARQNRYVHHILPTRAGNSQLPILSTIDIRHAELDNGLSRELIEQVNSAIGNRQQVLLFINRRGFSPSLLCHDCGWIATCPDCDTRLTVHRAAARLRCHHCEHTEKLSGRCPSCFSPGLTAVGVGTQRIEEALTRLYPTTTVLRVDRDSTTKRGTMNAIIEEVNRGDPCILIGTQMLAKGHHFPKVALVGIVDIDSGMFSADFRGAEHVGQLVTQVAGRAGRAEIQGQVLIQTHYPDHPLLTLLLSAGYGAFAIDLLDQRREREMPPYGHLALLRVESTVETDGERLLSDCRTSCQQPSSPVTMLGPLPSTMPRKAGRFRHILLLRCTRRAALHAAAASMVTYMEKHGRKLRWAIDMDPVETS